MNAKQALARLEALGTEQTRKTYYRHGVTGTQFGVKFGDLGKLVKEIGTDHGLALQLWKSGNHDAQVLAAHICDPSRFTRKELDGMVREVDNYVICEQFAKLLIGAPAGEAAAKAYMKHKAEMISAAGYYGLASFAWARKDDVDRKWMADALATIERTIHDRPNRTRHAMNQALICIGCMGGDLHKEAVAAAKRIGTVEVDHGDTACKTPPAIPYMEKVLAHQRKRVAGVHGRKKAGKKKATKKATKKAAKKAARKAAKKAANKKAAKKPPAKKKATRKKATAKARAR